MKTENADNPKVSVVIPMYNCAQFVAELFQMFLNQSFSDFEVICVIDGATDDTEQMVSNFCKSDSRFRYVVQENMGAGAARNTGLDLVRGDYTVFSDADDEYHADYLKKLYDTAVKHDAQIVICRMVMRNYKTNVETVLGFDEKRFQEDVPYSHADIKNLFGAFVSTMNNKMYNTSYLKDNRIRFQSIPVANDTFFVCAALSLADRIVVIDDILTYYRNNINPDSISSRRARLQHEAVNHLRLLYRWLKDHSLLDVHYENYMRKVNGSIIFSGKFDVNSRYISECAHMLNAEEPFNKMTTREILRYLRESLQANGATEKRAGLLASHSQEEIESDEELSRLLSLYSNRIRIAELLCKESKEIYGRDFGKYKSFHRKLKASYHAVMSIYKRSKNKTDNGRRRGETNGAI